MLLEMPVFGKLFFTISSGMSPQASFTNVVTIDRLGLFRLPPFVSSLSSVHIQVSFCRWKACLEPHTEAAALLWDHLNDSLWLQFVIRPENTCTSHIRHTHSFWIRNWYTMCDLYTSNYGMTMTMTMTKFILKIKTSFEAYKRYIYVQLI